MRLKRINLLLVILALTLVLILGLGVSTTNVALANDAETSGTYGGKDTDSLWYYSTTDLNIEAIREILIGWNIPSRLALDTYLKANPIVIAVADTGCNLAHEVFDGVLLQDENGEVIKYNSYNVVTQRTGVNDVTDNAKDYHGTGMMSTMAILIKDLGLQEYIKITPIKSSYTNTDNKKNPYEAFTLSATREAIRYAAEDIHADILNLSYGIIESKINKNNDWIHDEQLLNTITNACDQLVMVAAAGNDNKNSADEGYYLAANENVIGVMGYNESKNKYDSSNFGTAYDLYAPATNIYSASSGSNTYRTANGTSYATTMVSVAAALYELRYKVESFTGDDYPEVNPRKVARVVKQHSPSVITYTYTENAGTPNEKKITYTQPKLSLDSLLTEDYSDIDTKYDPVSGIGITQDGTQFEDYEDETLGHIKLAKVSIHDSGEINVKAYLKPKNSTDPALDRNITWVISDDSGERRVIASGPELKYFVTKDDVINSQEQTARIYLQAEYGTFVDTWYIDFQFDVYNNNSNVKLTADGKIKNGVIDIKKPITLSLSGLEYVNLNVGIIWYVNGEIFATTKTSSVTFTPTEEGTYTFSAQYAGWPKPVLNTVTVKAEINVWLIVTTSVAALLVLIAVGVVLLAFIKKNAKPKEKVEKNKEEKVEEDKQPYKPSVTVWLMIVLLVSFAILIAFYGVLMTKLDELSIDRSWAITGLVLILLLCVFVGFILAAQIIADKKKNKPVPEEPEQTKEEETEEEEAQPAEDVQEEMVEEQQESDEQ